MKMWIMLGTFSCTAQRSHLPSKCRVTDATNDCPQKSSEERMSKTVQIIGSLETYNM
jgi:hypothetical protein